MPDVRDGIPRPELQADAKSNQDLEFDGGHHIPRSFHIKDYPSREAQWVAAVKAWRTKEKT